MTSVDKIAAKGLILNPWKAVLLLLPLLLTAGAGQALAQSLPPGWSNQDVGSVGVAGSAGYSNGTFSIQASGADIFYAADGFHFVYQSLDGDGVIIARLVSLQDGGSSRKAGVMIRESLTAGSKNVYMAWQPGSLIYDYRTATGGSTSQTSTSANLAFWVKLVRSGNTFSGYVSPDGVNWRQVGTNQTITMAQTVYVGLAVTANNNSVLTTATIDGVSVNSAAQPAPVISSVSPAGGLPGTQAVISGSGFGASQGNSSVKLSGSEVTVNSWSDTSISITIPQGAAGGPLQVSVAPSMNNSAPALFSVLPSGWLDQDIGAVGTVGSATWSNGTFTEKGAGQLGGTSDKIHFVYQPLSGDGAVVARVSNLQGGSLPQVGVMIRESLNPDATCAIAFFQPNTAAMWYRTTTGASMAVTTTGFSATSYPYWVRVIRSGNTFTGYISLDNVNWTQIGSSQTITMAQNVYAGLSVSQGSPLITATIDFAAVTSTVSPAPIITALSATTGSIGSQLVISGVWFGSSQGNSAVYLNGAPMTINSWSDTSITVTIPSGATSGYLAVAVAPSMNSSNALYFAVTSQPLPSGWLNQDVGQVSAQGSATWSNGAFTVKGSNQVSSTSDKFHFVYQPLAGDGSIAARVANIQGGSSPQVAVIIRESMNLGAREALAYFRPNLAYLTYRTSDGASTASQTTGWTASSYPYWVKLVRSGSTFTGFISQDGVYWTQIGSQAVTMAQNVYVGLAVASGNTSLTTAAFDNVSVGSASSAAPIITGVSATTGSVGSQVVVTGTGFGYSQGNSAVYLNGVAMTINSWSDTSITVTIPSGATSGYLGVAVAPTMNCSNPVFFTVTSQPLPSGWLDRDVGRVGTAGSSTFANGTFTVKGSDSITSTSDKFHFVYQQLLGDGAMVARVATIQGGTNPQVGVIIRESLDVGSKTAVAFFRPNLAYLTYRTSDGGSASTQTANFTASAYPYWVRVTRNGNVFTGHISLDGTNWTQIGASQTITMAQTVLVGLSVGSGATTLTTATFDNMSVTYGATPLVTGLSPNLGGTGQVVTITGANFGATQGTSTVAFNGALASVTSWSDTQIVALVPADAPRGTGPVVVTVNTIPSISNVSFTVIRPEISSLSPSAATTGATVTVTGVGFGSYQGLSRLKFNGIDASVNSWSDTSITATVPANATSGPVTVTREGVVSNAVQFTVNSQFAITGISPSSGPVGSSVTFTGVGFGATQSSSTASFYGGQATVTSWSDTQIVVVVPAAAATGEVSVTVGGITAFGPVFTLTATVQLTDSRSNSSTYSAVMIGGQWLVSDAQGSGCSSCTQRGVVHHSLDSKGRIVSTTDELGRTTSYTYDSNGNVTSVSRPIGAQTATTSYTYNSFGQVLTVTDPLGHVTTNTYDAKGNLTSVTTPAPDGQTSASVTQFTYNALGQLTQITNPLNHVTTIAYNSVGLIASITDAQNNVTSYGYDARGNRTSVTDALGKTTTFTYDAGDRLTQITAPSPDGIAPGPVTTFAYDYRGRRTSVTDANNKTTTYAYDDADRLTSVTDAANNVTTYAYDTENSLISITDANLRTTYFEYDAFGRVTRTSFPSTLIETYAYDAAGNLTSKTDRKNQTITYVYDALDRLVTKTYPDSTQVEYVYDLVGKIQQVNDPTGTYSFAYDNMGRLIGTTTSYSFLPGRTFTVSYAYDAAWNRTQMTDPEGGVTAYAYDTLNRLTTLTPPVAFTTGSFGFTYDALSRRTQMTRPNNVTTNYTYDNLSRLLSVLHQLSGNTIDGASYTVDAVGNRTAKANLLPGAPVETYSYDYIYQLTQVVQNGSTTTENYTYDPAGNRLSSLGVSPYSYNVSNQLASTPSATYTYDGNGNTTSKTDTGGTTTYTWDYENRLTQVTLPGSSGAVSFKYDPFGRRIYKSSSSGTSVFAYDRDNLIEETNVGGSVVARYTQGPRIDEPLALLRAGATNFYNADGLGSITSLTNVTGSLSQTYTFDSFGKQTSSIGSTPNPFQFTAREFDSETNLYFYRARYYDPDAGRFLSEDPIAFLAGANFYRYVDNNPVFWRDASGLAPSGNIATLVPSAVLPGRMKLEGNLDPLCRKGRDILKDVADLTTSIATRQDEISWHANHPDPNMRALAGDPGHLLRIENEEETLARCKDTCPDEKPEPIPIPVRVKEHDWKKWLERNRVPVLVTAGVAVVVVAIALAPETGGASLGLLAAVP